MGKIFTALAIASALSVSSAVVPSAARADNGVAVGILGGLAAGAIIGSAVAPPPYYGPAPVYMEADPVYVSPPPYRCYWTQSEPVWDEYRGAWLRQRMQVCD